MVPTYWYWPANIFWSGSDLAGLDCSAGIAAASGTFPAILAHNGPFFDTEVPYQITQRLTRTDVKFFVRGNFTFSAKTFAIYGHKKQRRPQNIHQKYQINFNVLHKFKYHHLGIRASHRLPCHRATCVSTCLV